MFVEQTPCLQVELLRAGADQFKVKISMYPLAKFPKPNLFAIKVAM